MSQEKLYIIVNNTIIDKGKVARVCATIGACNPMLTLANPCIIVKGGDDFLQLFGYYHNRGKVCGKHIDSGKTQVESGTLLGFGVIGSDDKIKELKLY